MSSCMPHIALVFRDYISMQLNFACLAAKVEQCKSLLL